jgi:hypothetical protein
MRPESILIYVRDVPFRPFRLLMNSGRTYEVRHPEMIRVGRDTALLFHATDPEGPFERWETVSLVLVENVDHIDASAAAG